MNNEVKKTKVHGRKYTVEVWCKTDADENILGEIELQGHSSVLLIKKLQEFINNNENPASRYVS